MPNELETPPDFPETQDVKEGDKKKFLVEAECTGKEDDGSMEWDVISIDGVKIDDSKEEESESDEEGVSENYDTSQDEDDSEEEAAAQGKPKSTKGVAMLILRGKK